MPYVNIKITKDRVTADKNAEVIKGVTKLFQDVLGKNPQTTFVVIDEVNSDNWGIGGETVTERRKKSWQGNHRSYSTLCKGSHCDKCALGQ